MSRSVFSIAALIVLGLIPILLWGYVAYGAAISYQAAEAGARKAGQAAAILLLLLAALTPAFLGGIAMIVGAALLHRRPRGARIAATAGVGALIATVAITIAIEAGQAHYSMFIAAAAYVLVHVGLLALLWRSRRAVA